MSPIFKHGPSAQHRLLLVLFFSTLLIVFDHYLSSFETARGYLQSFVSPLQYLATAPKRVMIWTAENITSRQELIEQNQRYKVDELLLREQLMQLSMLEKENFRLRSLLASPVRKETRKMVAEVIAVDSDPYTHQVVINRGANDGVYEGQPVLDEQGIVGQIQHVGTISSRVILITDVTHAVPVRISRNGIRMIATGTGNIDTLIHNFVPHSTDVKSGDVLVTSGLGGKYPEGYPVSTIIKINKDESRSFAQLYSQPVAQIDRLRYLLLLWTESEGLLPNQNNEIELKSLDSSTLSSDSIESKKVKNNASS